MIPAPLTRTCAVGALGFALLAPTFTGASASAAPAAPPIADSAPAYPADARTASADAQKVTAAVAASKGFTVTTTEYFTGAPVTLRGTGIVGERIAAVFPGTPFNYGTADVGSDGHWSLISRFRVDEADGFTVAVTMGTGPSAIQIEQELTAAERRVAVDGGRYIRGERVTLHGTTDPYEDIAVTFPGEPYNYGITKADADGRWAVTSARPVDAGAAITVQVSTGPIESTKDIEHSLEAEDRILTVDDGTYVPDERVIVTGTANPGVRIVADFSSPGAPADVKVATAGPDGRWRLRSGNAYATKDGVTVTAVSGTGANELRVEKTVTATDRTLTVDEGTFVPGDLVTVTGTTNPGTAVTAVFPASADQPSQWAVGHADTTGRWSITSKELVDDDAPILVTVTSGDGTPTEQRVEQTLTPTARILTADPGTYVPGEPATISGTANAGARVFAHFDTSTTNGGSAVADNHGKWSITSPQPVRSRDSITVAVSSGPTGHGRTIEQTLTATDRTLTIDTSTFVRGERVVVRGSADPGAGINGRFRSPSDGDDDVTTTADDDGMWTFTSKRPVTGDEVSFQVSSGSGAFTKTLERTLTAATAPLVVTTKHFTKGKKQRIEGTAAAGARVDIYSGSKYLMNITADRDGHWAYTTGSTIATDTFTRTLKSTGSDDVTFTLTAATAPLVVTTKHFTKGKKQRIEGTAAAGARVDIYSGSKYLMNITADRDGHWAYTTGSTIATDTFTRTLKSTGSDDVTFTLTAK